MIAVASFYVYKNYDQIKLYVMQTLFPDNNPTTVQGDLSIHFINFDSSNTGDSVYIKAGTTDILVDSGPDRASSTDIYNYLCVDNKFITDNILEFVIVTHADQDHIAGLAGSKSSPSLFERFDCKTIIDFPKTNKDTDIYNDYITKRNAEIEQGAKRYSALECYNQTNGAKRIYDLSENVKLEILYNYYYENTSSDENNYSVCFMLKHGERNFLFTGDLEKHGEEKFVQYNNLPQVELFKAGHHGSKTSSNDILLNVIKPKICVACCVAGSNEYTNILENTFPTQEFIDRIAKYTNKVYITGVATLVPLYEADGVTPKLDRYGRQDYDIESYGGLNGNIVVSSLTNEVTVNCSVSNTLLKDTDWLKENRNVPSEWVA